MVTFDDDIQKIAGCYIDRRRGVFERAKSESSLGNWIGIAHPVLAELAYRVEGSPNRQEFTYVPSDA